MDETAERLAKCFSAVFPALAPEAIPAASSASLESWDSVANITLVSLVEEEFGAEIDVDEIEDPVSFSALLEYLREQRSAES